MIDMSPELGTILMFIGILTGLALGHPVAFILAGQGTIFALVGWGPEGWYMFLGRAFDSTTNNILIAIPNFVLMATLLGKSGIADRLFPSIMYLLGPLNGAIALAVIVWCADRGRLHRGHWSKCGQHVHSGICCFAQTWL